MSRALKSGGRSGLRILLTNDDGIHAPGLVALEKIAAELSDDVWVVAPENEQSGASHSLTLSVPLRLRHISERRYAVLGTPTDCVMMAIQQVMGHHRPDLILSGVNRGANMAEDVTYSGTIAGAMEGSTFGIPSIALSQAYGFEARDDVRWSVAETHGPSVIRALIAKGWPQDALINVNFPDVAPDGVKGVKVTVQGRRDQSQVRLERRLDGRHQPYYWLGFDRKPSRPAEGTDLKAIYEGWISVTPLHLDLTHQQSLKTLSKAFKAPAAAKRPKAAKAKKAKAKTAKVGKSSKAALGK
jgi:5'-nucleotidase